MRRKYDDFAVDLRHFVVAKKNKMLREEIHPDFKNEIETDKIVNYIKAHQMEDKSYFFLAKFEIQYLMKKIEKYFEQCTAAMWLYSQEDDDMYMLASPNLRNELDIKHGIKFNDDKNLIPYFSYNEDTIWYLDMKKPPTFHIEEVAKLWMEHGYYSAWAFPFHLEGEPIGSFVLCFDYDIGRLPNDAEIELIETALKSSEVNFEHIINDYHEFKCNITRKIL